jgi:hypothetical protein
MNECFINYNVPLIAPMNAFNQCRCYSGATCRCYFGATPVLLRCYSGATPVLLAGATPVLLHLAPSSTGGATWCYLTVLLGAKIILVLLRCYLEERIGATWCYLVLLSV